MQRVAAQTLPTPQTWANSRVTADDLRAEVLRRHAAGTAAGIRTTSRKSAWHRIRTLVAITSVAMLVATAIVFGPGLVGPRGQVMAQTPAPLSYQQLSPAVTAGDLLQQLAFKAGRQSSPKVGAYAYVKSRSWSLTYTATASESRGGDVTTDGKVIPSVRELWLALDGSGRIHETRGGHLTAASGKLPPHTIRHNSILPTNVAEIEELLARAHPGYGVYEWFVAVGDVANQGPIPPESLQALLTYLSRQRGMKVLGDVTDRIGRHGVAVTTTMTRDARTIQYVLILDPDTGTPWGLEQVTHVDPALPIELPATTSYTAWEVTGYSSTDLEPPR